MTGADQHVIHASTVAFACGAAWDGLVITGPSGSGKSSLALALMALGARLVADDQTRLDLRDGRVFASAPPRLSGLVEARNMGILKADPVPQAQVRACVDLTRTQTARLPGRVDIRLRGVPVALVQRIDNPAFPAMLRQYMLSQQWDGSDVPQSNHPSAPS